MIPTPNRQIKTTRGTQDNEEGANAAEDSGGLLRGLSILGLIVATVVIGKWLGARLGMPDHSWKLATILTTFAAAGLAIALGEFKLGPDLAGGTTLIYELEGLGAARR